MTNTAAENAARFTVTALVTWAGDVTRTSIGAASSRRAARRLAYRRGVAHTPSRFSVVSFDLEIIDTATGTPICSEWAETEMLRRARHLVGAACLSPRPGCSRARGFRRATMTTSTAQPFADLNAALDVLADTDVAEFIEAATDDLSMATSVETLDDFAANLAAAHGCLRKALAGIERLQARCPVLEIPTFELPAALVMKLEQPTRPTRRRAGPKSTNTRDRGAHQPPRQEDPPMTRSEKNVRDAIAAVEAAKERAFEVVLAEIAAVAMARGLSRVYVGADETTCQRGSRTVSCKPVLALVDMYNDVHPAGFIAVWTAEKGWL